eukprot:TRINITY_DN5155_c0_g1_i1.p1 TRINITY_DN5155_c0_g1~~TRINITY_DN5155_c0_g1_i1.p1  ORF type:complete len:433 (-),score=175.41 TRINITY_DN5155_c0_g1_i1:61-1359(-)
MNIPKRIQSRSNSNLVNQSNSYEETQNISKIEGNLSEFSLDFHEEDGFRKSLERNDRISLDSHHESDASLHEEAEESTLYPSKAKVKKEDFDFLRLVGRGGYGKVYQVRKRDNGQIYAMKVLRKDFLIETNNVGYTKMEKDILRTVNHPYIVKLHYAFQSDSQVCMVMDFLNGGQVYYHMKDTSMFTEKVVMFYGAQIVLALEHLHSLDIIHRDLKPENILFDGKGNISLTDFGLSKDAMKEGKRTSTFCGTIEYMAPEVIKGEGYGKPADWWSLGSLLFDMISGRPPFESDNEEALQKKICTQKLKIPSFFTSEASSLIKGLLTRDEKKRLGANGAEEIKKHRFFKPINWRKLLDGEITPPFKPKVSDCLDYSNFDKQYTSEALQMSPEFKLSESQERLFHGFSWAYTPSIPTSLLGDHEESEGEAETAQE